MRTIIVLTAMVLLSGPVMAQEADVTWPETCPASLPYPSGNDLRCHNGQHDATREYLLELSARVDSLEADLQNLTPEPVEPDSASILPSQFHAYQSNTTIYWVRSESTVVNPPCGVGVLVQFMYEELDYVLELPAFSGEMSDQRNVLCSGSISIGKGHDTVRVYTTSDSVVSMWAVHQTGLSHVLK